MSDGGVFACTSLGSALENGTLHLPPAKKLRSESNTEVPYFIVGDDAFPLKPYLMKPYAQRDLTHDQMTANYRISRARRTSENAFGILSTVFRVFHTPILLQPNKAVKIVRAACTLHNFLRQDCTQSFGRAAEEEHSTSQDVDDQLTPLRANTHSYSQQAKDIRNELLQYLTTTGRVEWQHRYIQSH